jgi:transposase
MARDQSELTDAQWEKIAPLLPERKASPRGGPKPIPNWPVFEGILWLLRSGARWQDLPARFPSPSTCWRRLRGWEEQDVWLKAWRPFLAQLDAQGQLEWSEAFADGSFAPAKNGGLCRADQTRQGYEVDGGGRRPRYSSGKPLGLGVPGRGEMAGTDAGDGCRAPHRPWPPSEATGTSDLRERL